MYTLTGPPGCGKSTQVELLKKFNFSVVSAGELLRNKAPKDILEPILKGSLADHKYTNKLVGEALDRLKADNYPTDKIILDGYPRALVQVKWLMEEYRANVSGCIVLNADSVSLTARLLERGRTDDVKASIEKRFNIFNDNIESILSYYKSKSVDIFRIDALQTIEEIHLQIKQIFNLD